MFKKEIEYHLTIKELPQECRPRERLLEKGRKHYPMRNYWRLLFGPEASKIRL